MRESATLPAVTLWWSTWVAEPPRERERVALGEGGRVYGEGRRDIREGFNRESKGRRAGDKNMDFFFEKFIKINSDGLIKPSGKN